jgi:dihydrolipoamide dehydrogenase
MLHASEYYDAAANGAFAKLGIKVKPELDLDAMHGQRKDAVKGLTGGIEFLFKKNKVEWVKGYATFTGPTRSRSATAPSPPRTSSSPPVRR